MSEKSESTDETCTHEACERTVKHGERCYWHRRKKEKCPKEEVNDEFPTNLIGASLFGADLTGADLAEADLTDTDFRNADLTDAVLRSADLTDADLRFASLTGTNLFGTDLTDALLHGADLTNAKLSQADIIDADLRYAGLSGTNLFEADINGSDLRGAMLTDADLRGATVSNLTLDRETTVNTLYEPTGDAGSLKDDGDSTESELDDSGTDPNDWDQVARAYHTLKHEFNENGLVTRARRFHRLERCARRNETRVEKSPFSWAHIKQFASGAVTGYGVSVWQVFKLMFVLFTVSTLIYFITGIDRPLYYSIITFTTSPPPTPSSLPLYARFVAGVETFGGTLLLITLGFVLSNREQF